MTFGLRHLVALSGFWITDSRGMEHLALVLSLFFSGTLLSPVVFPGWIGEFARATRGRRRCRCRSTSGSAGTREVTGAALMFQLGWMLVLLLAGQLATSLATRKVVIQGG